MKTIELNITFKNLEECQRWESENLKRVLFENGCTCALCVYHDTDYSTDKVTLTMIQAF